MTIETSYYQPVGDEQFPEGHHLQHHLRAEVVGEIYNYIVQRRQEQGVYFDETTPDELRQVIIAEANQRGAVIGQAATYILDKFF